MILVWEKDMIFEKLKDALAMLKLQSDSDSSNVTLLWVICGHDCGSIDSNNRSGPNSFKLHTDQISSSAQTHNNTTTKKGMHNCMYIIVHN